MIRREFMKMLAGLPFLGFLRGKTEDERNVEDSLESLKEPGGVPLETFAQTLGTMTYYVVYLDGRFVRYSENI